MKLQAQGGQLTDILRFPEFNKLDITTVDQFFFIFY